MDDLLLPRRRSLLTALAILAAVLLLLKRIPPAHGTLPLSIRADIRVTGLEAWLPRSGPARAGEPAGADAESRVYLIAFGAGPDAAGRQAP